MTISFGWFLVISIGIIIADLLSTKETREAIKREIKRLTKEE
jgi:hypothetical protein